MWPPLTAQPSANAFLTPESSNNSNSPQIMKIIYSTILLSLVTGTSMFPAAFAQAPSADDFVVPATAASQQTSASSREIKEPNKVKVSQQQVTTAGGRTPVVQAASMQDAINTAVTLKQNIVQIETGSGLGVVARGYGSYTQYPNRNASLISKRQAYTKAYMMAKKELTLHLYGLSNESKQKWSRAMDTLDTATNTLANTGAIMSESIEQKTEGLIRGFVITI